MSAPFQAKLPPHSDPIIVELFTRLQQQLDAKAQQLEAQEKQVQSAEQELKYARLKIQVLEERLRLARIAKYGKRSETLSDLQLELLDLEPGVSSEEVEAESQREPLRDTTKTNTESSKQQRSRKRHPGRNELPAHLERVEKVIACAPEHCTCGKCGGETKIIGYEETEVLDVKPAEFFVTVLKREKRACARCEEHGVTTAAVPERILPKSIFSDEVIIDFTVKKYCDALPLYRQQTVLWRDAGLDVPLSTINDAVLRVGEVLIPVVDRMKSELLAGSYLQADETPVGVQTPEKKGENHKGYFWQYGSPGRGVVFDFAMTRSGEVPRKIFKDFRGILQTDGYAGYGDDVGAEGTIHACCMAHARRKFIEAVKVNAKDRDSARVVELMDALFAIDREAREQKMSIADRHALRQERAPALLEELHALLVKMKGQVLPKSAAGKAAFYALVRWEKLTRFMQYPVLELSTNLAENSMRPIAIGRRNWLHLGSKEAGPKIAAIFSVIESCRRLGVPIRKYLADVLPGMSDRSIQSLADLTPAAYAAKMAK